MLNFSNIIPIRTLSFSVLLFGFTQMAAADCNIEQLTTQITSADRFNLQGSPLDYPPALVQQSVFNAVNKRTEDPFDFGHHPFGTKEKRVALRRAIEIFEEESAKKLNLSGSQETLVSMIVADCLSEEKTPATYAENYGMFQTLYASEIQVTKVERNSKQPDFTAFEWPFFSQESALFLPDDPDGLVPADFTEFRSSHLAGLNVSILQASSEKWCDGVGCRTFILDNGAIALEAYADRTTVAYHHPTNTYQVVFVDGLDKQESFSPGKKPTSTNAVSKGPLPAETVAPGGRSISSASLSAGCVSQNKSSGYELSMARCLGISAFVRKAGGSGDGRFLSQKFLERAERVDNQCNYHGGSYFFGVVKTEAETASGVAMIETRNGSIESLKGFMAVCRKISDASVHLN
jgi:hypothetical protein